MNIWKDELRSSHKKAASLIRKILEEGAPKELYESQSTLPKISTQAEWCDRFHYYIQEARIQLTERQLLQVRKNDGGIAKPFLPIDIYLDNLRSAHNVGSIIRTNEAFRIGEVYFGGYTPHGPKMHKTSMGAENHVICHFKPGWLPKPPRYIGQSPGLEIVNKGVVLI